MARRRKHRRETNYRPWQIALVAVLAVGAGVLAFAALRPTETVASGEVGPAPTYSYATSRTPAPVTVAEVVARIKDPNANVSVSVLGDSTGNEPTEWVHLWAEHIAQTKTVRFFQWDDAGEFYPDKPEVLGSGGGTVTIWNGSKHGSQGQYARDRQALIQPSRPDFIIYNYGHNSSPDGVAADLAALQTKAESKWGKIPFAVTVQNPARGTREATSAAAGEQARAWAGSVGAPVVDVPAAWSAAGETNDFLADEVHPNTAGSRVWADLVISTFG